MTQELREKIAISARAGHLLIADLRSAHSLACRAGGNNIEGNIASLHLRALIGEAVQLSDKLNELYAITQK